MFSKIIDFYKVREFTAGYNAAAGYLLLNGEPANKLTAHNSYELGVNAAVEDFNTLFKSLLIQEDY